jgi:uracil-DNA glycosylase
VSRRSPLGFPGARGSIPPTVDRTLEVVRQEALVCTKCRLAGGRTQVVFGVGSATADLMFIGEAPGFHEDKQGEPFVGAAGQLLTKLLGDIGLRREDVWISNVLLCRPPGNRDPMPDEIDECKPWLKEQIDLIDPRVVATLGNFSTQLLLGKKVGITKVRGQRFDWRGRVLVPTFHPAAILRSGSAGLQMQQVEQDFLLIRKTLDEAPAAAPEDPSEQLGLFQ